MSVSSITSSEMPFLDIEIQRADGQQNVGPSDKNFLLWLNMANSYLISLGHTDQDNTELCLRLVDQSEIKNLNRDYRGKDKSTNVLSFPFEKIAQIPEQNILGDIVLCRNVIETEATEQGKRVEAHWAHMCIHGFLHLCGYDHIDQKEAQAMEALETKILAEMNFPSPWN